MELKSLNYVVFAAIVILAYYILYKVKYSQRIVLLTANVVFILSISDFRSFVLIFILAAVSFGNGILIENRLNKGEKARAHALLYCGIAFSIIALCYFKFFKESFTIIQNCFSNYGITLSDIVSPIGISYYTLTMIAYMYDIFHGKHKAERNFLDYFVFITFFPSIIQGPINLYKKTAFQFKETHAPKEDTIVKGIQRVIWGYFKKVVIADRIGILVTGILQFEYSTGFVIFWAMVLYSFQIYADFSGGIDVIMGISEALDIKLTENFKSPLVSKSVTEYWQRWHMSLGEFMEKYLYYPIVLNRRIMRLSKKIHWKYLQKVFSATLASIIVFVIVGIWHGTGWNYVVYGCYQAFFVSTAVLLGPVYKKIRDFLRLSEESISWRVFQIIRTFIILTFGRFFIRAKDLTQAFELIGKMFERVRWSDVHILFDDTLTHFELDSKNISLMYIGILLLIIVDVMHERKIKIRELFMKQDVVFRFAIYFVAIFSIIILGIYGPEFVGSSFIYQNF